MLSHLLEGGLGLTPPGSNVNTVEIPDGLA